MSYHRSSSPGTRRLALGHPARLSDGYYPTSAGAISSYAATPRSSGERIVPVTRDAYSGRPRRSTVTEPNPTASASVSSSAHHLHPRSRPAVIQAPLHHVSTSTPTVYHSRQSEHYALPASSHKDHTHKKLYTIDGGGKSRLVADIDVNTAAKSSYTTTKPQHEHSTLHRRHSVDRNPERLSASHHHRQKGYHLSGPSLRPDQGYSYTEPAPVYRDTEPRRRHRAGSVEATRPRPMSAVIDSYPPPPPRVSAGPPTSRGLDRFNDALTRSTTTATREPPRSSSRLPYQDPQYPPDLYSASANRQSAAVHQDHPRDAYPKDPPKQRYEDRSVERRGFGIRSGSQDRYNHNMNRGSNESFDAYYSDRDHAAQPRNDPRAYDHSKDYDRDRDYRQKDRERLRDDGYNSERDRRHDRDRRDRGRDRRDRDLDLTPRGSGDSLTNTLLPAAAIGGLGAMAAAAAYGSADAATTTTKNREQEYEDRDRNRDRDREREKDRDRERELEHERKQREREREHREKERERRDRERSREVDKESERLHEHETRNRERQHHRERDRLRHSSSSDSDREGTRSSRRHRTVKDDDSPPRETDARNVSDERQRTSDPDRHYESDDRRRAAERDRAAPVDPPAQLDPDEDYRRRMEQAQRELQGSQDDAGSDRDRRPNGKEPLVDRNTAFDTAPGADGYESTTRESRVRIVEPPSDKESYPPVKGILKKPTQQFPDYSKVSSREGVAPLNETVLQEEGIPTNARWTRIDRRLVNPKALEEAKERFEERLDCVIVLRVVTKDEIQKLAYRTQEIRARPYGDEDRERRMRREERRRERERERRDRDEYEDDDSEDEYAPREPRMLEAPGQDASADFIRDRERRRERENEREPAIYASGAL